MGGLIDGRLVGPDLKTYEDGPHTISLRRCDLSPKVARVLYGPKGYAILDVGDLRNSISHPWICVACFLML